MRHIFINHLNASAGLHHSELVYLRCFFVFGVENTSSQIGNMSANRYATQKEIRAKLAQKAFLRRKETFAQNRYAMRAKRGRQLFSAERKHAHK